MGTNFNYDDTSHQIIFDHINGGAGSGSLQQAGQAWQRLSEEIGATGKAYVQSSISGMLANREGAAAEAAASATSAMLPWMDDVALVATTAAQRAQGQAEYWVTAKNTVPPVPPTPKAAGFFSDPTEWAAQRMDWLPGLTTEEEKAEQRQQDAAEQARQAMRTYQVSSNGNVELEPAFTAPQALDASIGTLPLSDPRVGTTSAPPPATAGHAPAHLLAAHQPPAHPLPRTHQPAATVAQLAGNRHTAATPPSVGTGSPTPSQAVSSGAPVFGATTPGTPGVSDSARRAGRSGAAGARFTGAARGAAESAEFGPRPRSGFGPRPTISAEPPPGEAGATRGIAGVPGAARGAGAGAGYGQPLPAGAGNRAENDREHRSKYLVHDDSHAIVGELPPTAPPVIGADY